MSSLPRSENTANDFMFGSLETKTTTLNAWEHIMKKWFSISIAGILALSAPGIAKADFIITFEVGGVPSVSGATLVTFNENVPLPSTLTLTLSGPTDYGSAVLVTGDAGEELGYVYTAPFYSGGTAAYFSEPEPHIGYDSSQYVAVWGYKDMEGSPTTAELSFSTPQTYLGLLWGSVGTGNRLSFYDSDGGLIGSISGDDVFPPEPGYGENGTVYVNIISTTPFSSVVATDQNDAFEFDDVAYGQAVVVPEPTTVVAGALLLLPFGASTLRILRKTRTA